MAAPRIWPSTAVTVSASAISRITWLIPTPHRLTVYASAAPLPDAPATLVIGRLARPYPNGTFPRRIALTSPSARRLRRKSAGQFDCGPYFPLALFRAAPHIRIMGEESHPFA